jgi:hypothetical protein
MIQLIGLIICARVFCVGIDAMRTECKVGSWERSIAAVVIFLVSMGASLFGMFLLLAAHPAPMPVNP